jgi:signal transduction histidine kinase
MLQERNRIAREIHDALGHSLTAQSIQLENALVYLDSNREKSKGFLLAARQLSSDLLQEVRHSVTTLRSDPLQGKSLNAAIKLLISPVIIPLKVKAGNDCFFTFLTLAVNFSVKLSLLLMNFSMKKPIA